MHVGAEQPAARRALGRRVEVDDLAERVDTGVGAAGTEDRHRVIRDARERALDLGLDRRGVVCRCQPA